MPEGYLGVKLTTVLNKILHRHVCLYDNNTNLVESNSQLYYEINQIIVIQVKRLIQNQLWDQFDA
jgi:hypothetical protein